MRRRMCDIEGCHQDGVFVTRITVQVPRDVQRREETREYGDEDRRPDFIGELDLCEPHAMEMTVAEIHQQLDQQLRERVVRETQNPPTARGLQGLTFGQHATRLAVGGAFPQVAENVAHAREPF